MAQPAVPGLNAGHGYAVQQNEDFMTILARLEQLEGARRDIAGAALAFGGPLPRRTLLPFS